MEYSDEHETVEVFNPFCEEMINIDKDISDLISLLWGIGLMTHNSCQENKPGIIWIEFPFIDAERFINIICNEHEDSIYQDVIMSDSKTDWQYEVCIDDFSERINENDEIEVVGPPDLVINLSIIFPKKDYDEILSRVKKWKDLYGSINEYDNREKNI